MLKYQYLLLLLLIGTCTFAQSTQNKKADSLYAAKSYLAAGRYYLLAANIEEFKTLKIDEYYNAACSYALGGKADSAMILLKKSVENGYKDGAHLKVDTDLGGDSDEPDHLIPGQADHQFRGKLTRGFRDKLTTLNV